MITVKFIRVGMHLVGVLVDEQGRVFTDTGFIRDRVWHRLQEKSKAK